MNEPDVDQISLGPVFHVLWSYRRAVGVGVGVALLVYCVFALYLFSTRPFERQANITFRLGFGGADAGTYPNGLPFSVSEITGTEVLDTVYRQNEIERYSSFDEFRSQIFVLESNPRLTMLALEYEDRLATPGITFVERNAVEREFLQARASQISQYALTYLVPNTVTPLPGPLVAKVLQDVLRVWADDAVNRRGVLSYQSRVLDPEVLFGEASYAAHGDRSATLRVDILRSGINRITAYIDQLLNLPGATVIRAGGAGSTLPALRARIEDLRRFELEPIVDQVWGSNLVSRESTLRYLESRLRDVRQTSRAARNQVTALQGALQGYITPRGGGAAVGSEALRNEVSSPVEPVDSSVVQTQIGESFLNSLVGLVNDSGDSEYRQSLTDRIIEADLLALELASEENYYLGLREMIRTDSRPTGVTPLVREDADARLDQLRASVVGLLTQVNELYFGLSSQNLNPQTGMYSVTSPVSAARLRGLTIRTLGLNALLTMLTALVLIPLACLVHYYGRRYVVR